MQKGKIRQASEVSVVSNWWSNTEGTVISDYQKAVFVNTVVAAAHVKADFSAAKSRSSTEPTTAMKRHLRRRSTRHNKRRQKIGGGFWSSDIGASVEFEKGHIDVDLYYSKQLGGFFKHQGEIWFNKNIKGEHILGM